MIYVEKVDFWSKISILVKKKSILCEKFRSWSKKSIFGKNVEKVDFWRKISILVDKVDFGQKYRISRFLVKNLGFGRKSRFLVKNVEKVDFGEKF